MIPLFIRLYAPGAGGIPSTAEPIPIELGSRAEYYQHTISDRYGFESMTVRYHCSYEEALFWLHNGLMCSVTVYSPDAWPVWEGYLETVNVTLGQKRASLSLGSMANRCRVLYTDSGGTPKSSSIVSSTSSQALYGVKDRATTLFKSSSSAADAAAAAMLASFAYPRSRETTEAATGALGDIAVELLFAGWYSTLGWVFASRNSSSTTDTGTQISGYIIPTIASTNAFLSTDVSQISSTSVSDTEYIAPNTYYLRKVEALLSLGNSSNQQLTWGVYEDRIFKTAVWAGASPATIAYTEDAGTGVIFDSYGNIVRPWDVRPNAMSQVAQLLDVGIPTGAIDAAARKYVGRVTCSVQGEQIGCTLEPSSVDSFDAFLATLLPPAGW